jgi:hypothetical protein
LLLQRPFRVREVSEVKSFIALGGCEFCDEKVHRRGDVKYSLRIFPSLFAFRESIFLDRLFSLLLG